MATRQVTSTNTQGPVTIAYVKPTVNTHGLNPSSPSMNATVTSTPNQCYKVKAARITGAIQITCALASVISGVVILLLAACTVGDVDTCKEYPYSTWFPAVIAWPIWGAVCFYAVAGGIGMCSANGRTCPIVGYMVMSIIAAAVALGQVCNESVGAAIHAEYCDYNWNCYVVPGLSGMHGFAAAVAFVEMVVAIVAAAFCCHGVCSCCRGTSNPAQQQVVVQYVNVNPESQIVQQGKGFLQEPPALNNQLGPTEEPRYVTVN